MTIKITAMTERQQELIELITIKPGLMGGKPTVRGLRFHVRDVLELMASGLSDNHTLKAALI